MTTSTPHGKGLVDTFQRIKERTNGELEITHNLYIETPYKATEALEIVRDGLVEIVEWNPIYYAGTYPFFGVPELPFLSPRLLSPAEMAKAESEYWEVGAMGEALNRVLEEHSAVEVSTYFMEPSSFYFAGEVKSLADIEGKRLRVYSQPLGTLMMELGATPVSITAPDVYSALQRGGLDGVITTPSTVEGLKWSEQMKSGFIVNLHAVKQSQLVSKAKLDALSPEVREIFLEEMQKFEAMTPGFADDNKVSYHKLMEEKGVTITTVSEEEYTKLHQIAKERVWPAWVEQQSQEVKDAYEAVLTLISK